MRIFTSVMALIIFYGLSISAKADIQAVGLMPNMAILEVNGERVVIRKGQTKYARVGFECGQQLCRTGERRGEIISS